MADRTVLVTGAAGLLGTWLRRTAPPDVDLVALTHRTRLSDVREVVADLRDAGACLAAVRNARPTLVIHARLAAAHQDVDPDHVLSARRPRSGRPRRRRARR